MEPILQLLNGGVGLGVACLILACWWLAKNNDKERNARIVLLESSAERCALDRVELHKQMGELQSEVRGLMKQIVAATADGCGARCMGHGHPHLPPPEH